MSVGNENGQDPLPLSGIAEKQSSSTHKLEPSKIRSEEVGRLVASLYVLAGFVTYINVSGTLISFGVYQEFYLSDRLSSHSASSISWIGSVQVFLAIGFGVFAGPLYDRGYLRPLVLGGSSLTILGIMMTSIAHSYYQIFLAQGVCVGLGMGLAYVPTLGEISIRFTKRRAVALGLCSTGACVGGVIYPALVTHLVPRIGFGWTVRVVACINLVCGMIACGIICRRPNQAHSTRRALDFTAFREPPFTCFVLGMFLVFLPYYAPLTYIPTFAKTALGTSDDLAGYLLSIINGTSLLGRTVPYILTKRVTPISVFFFSVLAAAVCLFGWIGVTSVAGLIVWCIFWGVLSGAVATAPIAAASHAVLTPTPGELGTRMGMSLLASAIGELVGPPLIGALADVAAAQYVRAQAVSGAFMLAGGLCLLWPLLSIHRYTS